MLAALVEMSLALVGAVVTARSAYQAFGWLTRDIGGPAALRKGSLALGIVLAAVTLACGLVVKEAVFPSVATFRSLAADGMTALAWGRALGYALAYLLVANVLALVGVGLGARLYALVTHEVDEWAEVANGNLGVAVSLGAVILLCGWFISQGASALLYALMPAGTLAFPA